MPKLQKISGKKINVELTDIQIEQMLEIIGREPLQEVYDLATVLITALKNGK